MSMKKSGWPYLVLTGAAAKDTAQQWNSNLCLVTSPPQAAVVSSKSLQQGGFFCEQ
ncbi:hypothetical protein AAIP46_003448 [Yersinia ruckeri]|uniref:hypothetical protein n=1 Tax=Yersinia ruckeri TaxID=29486 RepID=UPI000AE3FB75|nr:hypothetical protein [Yersinia ruckeri]EKN4691740.1 hypothetical protein [Yersinia ruckeri]MCW6651608.1 hypothetical protein [Yersinia ruckeri]